MGIQHNNHYVPQMYLNTWGTDNKIFEYRLLVSNEKVPVWSRESIEHVASLDYLYVHVVDGNEFDDIEKEFDVQFETPAKIPLMKAIQGDRMYPDDWKKLISYVTAQYVRTPKFYLQCKQLEESIFPSVMEGLAKELEEMVVPPETIQDKDLSSLLPVKVEILGQDENGTANANITMVAGKNTWLFTIRHILSGDSDVLNIMHMKKWRVVTSHPDVTWPTCDNPFVIFTINKKMQYSITDGIGQPMNYFVFPLSPRKALLCGNKAIPPNLFLTKDESIMIKNLIIHNAYLYVYSDLEDPDIPVLLPRCVDLETYKRIYSEQKNWFDVYKSQEGPFLHRR